MQAFPDIVNVPEGQLVERLFESSGWRAGLGRPPQMSGEIVTRLRVSPADLGLSKAPFGDVDALSVNRDAPHLARATEYKRLKISASNIATDTVTKLTVLRKAAHQANALIDAGFAYVWLNIVLVADLRSLAGPADLYPPIPQSLINTVQRAMPLGEMHPSVGVSLCEICQVCDHPAEYVGTAGWSMIRAASEQSQPDILTSGVERLFRLGAA